MSVVLMIGGGFVARAQVGASPDPEGTAFEVTDPGRSLNETARTALAEARRQLEDALTDPDGNVRFEALREAIHLREPWIAEVVLPLCNSPDLTEQNFALEAIAATNPKQGRAEFLKALKSPRRSIRLRGLLGLEKLADPETVVDVIRVLEADEDPDLKVVAARTLGAIGDIGGSTPLRSAIRSPHAPLRRQAVLSLLAIGKEDVGRYLIRILDDDNPIGTVEILKLVALVPDPSLIELLTPYLDHERQRIRSHAAVTILSILERSGTSAH
jgi:HEAT repeat protein